MNARQAPRPRRAVQAGASETLCKADALGKGGAWDERGAVDSAHISPCAAASCASLPAAATQLPPPWPLGIGVLHAAEGGSIRCGKPLPLMQAHHAQAHW